MKKDFYFIITAADPQLEMITFCFLSAQGGCESQLTRHAAANMKIGNDKQFLIKIISQCLPFIGYLRSLNALRCEMMQLLRWRSKSGKLKLLLDLE